MFFQQVIDSFLVLADKLGALIENRQCHLNGVGGEVKMRLFKLLFISSFYGLNPCS